MKLIFFFALFFTYSYSRKLYLDSNNKFQDLLVFINDNVDQSDGLLDRIKDHINKASESLWKATSNMDANKAGVQFGTVYIRIPETWTSNSIPITWQQCNTASFYVIKNEQNNERPFTKQLGKCGEPGNFTRFPESFFKEKSEADTIKAGKDIMVEFVKLRYGVFSEKPSRNVLTAFTGHTFINSTCGKNVQWTINKSPLECQEPNEICKYSILPNQNHNYSVMFDTETHSSEFFCDDHRRPHNPYAKNLHNKICKKRSVTNVILSHKDFALPKPQIQSENVNFVIVKGQSRKLVLVLDTSGSMMGIIANMKQATVKFLETVESSAEIGIVQFSSMGVILSNFLSMNTQKNRDILISVINQLAAGGGTNIPDGLAKGITVLGSSIDNDDKVFGTIILLTDGESNSENPYTYEYAISQIIKKRILVNAIAYGNQADSKMTSLTKGTGGKYFYANPNTVYLELLGKLSAKQSCEISIDQEIKVMENTVNININSKIQYVNLTYVDKYVGSDLKLSMTIPQQYMKYIIVLVDPVGREYSYTDKISQNNRYTIIFQTVGQAKAGMYRIKLTDLSSSRYKRSTDFFTLQFTISAKPKEKSSRIINPTGELSSSEINKLVDTTTVTATVDLTTCGILTEENVNVTLIMDTPTDKKITKSMTDDGIGDDSIEDDKIYTKVLLAKDLEEIGFYSFRANVEISSSNNTIRRAIELGSLRVKSKQPAPIKDKIPPAVIENCILHVLDPYKRRIKIQFIAPGNDGMNGNITKYEIIINSSMLQKQEFSSDKPARDKVEYEMKISENITNPFEISVRGIDDSGNEAEWSQAQISNFFIEDIVKTFDQGKHANYGMIIPLYMIIVCLIAALWDTNDY